MDNLNIELLKKLVSDNTDIVDFAPFGEGVNPKRIQEVENKLGLSFSISFKWWLENYAGGTIGDDEIYSIYDEKHDNVPGGNIVFMRNLYLKQPGNNKNELIILDNIFGTYYFDLTSKDSNYEYLIFEKKSNKVYATDFIDFLIKRINDFI